MDVRPTTYTVALSLALPPTTSGWAPGTALIHPLICLGKSAMLRLCGVGGQVVRAQPVL